MNLQSLQINVPTPCLGDWSCSTVTADNIMSNVFGMGALNLVGIIMSFIALGVYIRFRSFYAVPLSIIGIVLIVTNQIQQSVLLQSFINIVFVVVILAVVMAIYVIIKHLQD